MARGGHVVYGCACMASAVAITQCADHAFARTRALAQPRIALYMCSSPRLMRVLQCSSVRGEQGGGEGGRERGRGQHAVMDSGRPRERVP